MSTFQIKQGKKGTRTQNATEGERTREKNSFQESKHDD